MDRLDDIQKQFDCLENWLWQTYLWVKEFYQDWGEEMHHSFILKRIETLKDDMKEKIKLLEDEMNEMKEKIQSLENDIKAMNTLMKGRNRLKKMKAKKGRKVLKTMK